MANDDYKRLQRELEYLRSVLRYDPNTGLFHWRIKRCGSPKRIIYPGDVASSKDVRGYIVIGHNDPWGKRHQLKAHRLAFWFMTGRPPRLGMDISHLDANPANNRWSNLAEVPRFRNLRNPNDKLRSSNKSGHRGIVWRRKRWHVQIRAEGRQIHVGCYVALADALTARKQAEKLYWDAPKQLPPPRIPRYND